METESVAVNFSNEERLRSDCDGLTGELGTSSSPFATTASTGRRGRLYNIERLRDGGAESESDSSAFLAAPRVGDCSSTLDFVFLADGEGDREGEPQGFFARLTILPDIERPFEGRAAGSGIRCPSNFGAASCGLISFRSSEDESVKCETVGGDFVFERRDVRRRMSFPAATDSFVGESDTVGTA